MSSLVSPLKNMKKCWEKIESGLRRLRGENPRKATSVERLVAKLRAAGYSIPDDWKFQRFYPGHWQRSAGAWVWRLYWGGSEIGSPESVRNCLKAKEFCDGPYNEVYPKDWK